MVTKGIRLVVCLSLTRKLSSCVSDRTLRISDSALSLLYPHATKKLEYSNILCFRMVVDEHILLSLKAWLLVYFSLNAVDAPKSNVGMGGYPLVSEKCLY